MKKPGKTREVLRTPFIPIAGLVPPRIVDTATAQQIMGINTVTYGRGVGCADPGPFL